MATPPKSSPRSSRGVNFYQQFVRSFIRPYGPADSAPNDETIFRRIKPFTCEWLVRPKVALSELAETLQKNMVFFGDESNQGLLNEKTKDYIKNEFAPLLQPLHRLAKESQEEPTRDDVLKTLRFLYQDNDRLDEMVNAMFLTGGALFAVACQYIVARTVIRNPGKYGKLV